MMNVTVKRRETLMPSPSTCSTSSIPARIALPMIVLFRNTQIPT